MDTVSGEVIVEHSLSSWKQKKTQELSSGGGGEADCPVFVAPPHLGLPSNYCLSFAM